jgi:hypothetical protein
MPPTLGAAVRAALLILTAAALAMLAFQTVLFDADKMALFAMRNGFRSHRKSCGQFCWEGRLTRQMLKKDVLQGSDALICSPLLATTSRKDTFGGNRFRENTCREHVESGQLGSCLTDATRKAALGMPFVFGRYAGARTSTTAIVAAF